MLAAAIPFLFFHIDFQPGFTVDVGSLSAHAVLSDFAVLAVAVVAVVAGVRHGFAPLRAGWPIWLAGGLFVLLAGAASLYPRLWDDAYDVSTHAVTAAKFGEYALLAPAVPLLLRTARDLELVLAALVVWATAAAAVGVLQIFGVDFFDAWSPGRRQPSFLGHYDLAALCGAALLLAVIVLALRPAIALPAWLLVAAGAAGAVGVTVSGSAAAGLGLAAATAAVLLVAAYLRRLTVRRALASVGDRRRRCGRHPRHARRRRRPVRPLPRHPRARSVRAGERPDLRAAHDARVHRLAGVPRPSRGGGGLAGLRRRRSRSTATTSTTPGGSSRTRRRRHSPHRSTRTGSRTRMSRPSPTSERSASCC